jgi:hypothetical protein
VRQTSSPELADARDRTLRALADHLADIVIQGQNDGSLRPDVDPEAAAWCVLSILVTRALRAPADVEPSVTALVLGALQRSRE